MRITNSLRTHKRWPGAIPLGLLLWLGWCLAVLPQLSWSGTESPMARISASVLPENGHPLDVESAALALREGHFTPTDPRYPDISSVSGRPVWLHLSVDLPKQVKGDWWLLISPEPIERLTLYQQDASGHWYAQAGGALEPFSSRKIRSIGHSFPLDAASGESRDYFIRFDTRAFKVEALILPEAEMVSRLISVQVFYALYVGVVLVIIAGALYRTLLWRNSKFMAYAIYLISFETWFLSTWGILGLLGLMDNMLLRQTLSDVSLFCASVSLMFLARHLITIPPDTQRLMQQGLRILLALIAVTLWAVVLLRPDFLSQFNMFLTMALLGTVFLAAIWAAWRRFEGSLQFLLCFMPLLGISFSLEVDRWFHITQLDNWSRGRLMMAGSLFHMLLLLGMALKIENGAIKRERKLQPEMSLLRRQMANLEFFVKTLSRELEAPIRKLEQHVGRQQPATPSMDGDTEKRELFEVVSELRAATIFGIKQSRLASQSDMHSVPTDIATLVAGVVATFQQHSQHHLVTYEPGKLPEQFFCDRRLLAIAIVNLLDNAGRYSPEGSPIWITSALTAPGTIEITISDDGPGIKGEEQERIFSPCYGEGTEASQPGYGIGLFIARRIAELHGGSVSLDSTEGEGATFVLRIRSVQPTLRSGSSTVI
jgi:two-component system, sensor histidine kinase LadS